MGGVQIKNCTAVPIKIELCQAGVLYYARVQPGEFFNRNTGAVHFTICVTVTDEDDAGWWSNDIVPSLVNMATNYDISGAHDQMIPDSQRLVIGATSAKLTQQLAKRLFLNDCEQSHYYISSGGWYFGGKNELEVQGGPRILAHSTGYKYIGSPLRIVDKNDSSRHN